MSISDLDFQILQFQLCFVKYGILFATDLLQLLIDLLQMFVQTTQFILLAKNFIFQVIFDSSILIPLRLWKEFLFRCLAHRIEIIGLAISYTSGAILHAKCLNFLLFLLFNWFALWCGYNQSATVTLWPWAHFSGSLAKKSLLLSLSRKYCHALGLSFQFWVLIICQTIVVLGSFTLFTLAQTKVSRFPEITIYPRAFLLIFPCDCRLRFILRIVSRVLESWRLLD